MTGSKRRHDLGMMLGPFHAPLDQSSHGSNGG
jgi:hypothetical protein